MRRLLAFFIPAAVVATLGCLVVAGAVQQDLRQGADDPQHQLAEDAVARLDAGDAPAAVVGAGRIDLATSLDPFVVVYDAGGRVVATNGALDGAPPVPPIGVLATAHTTGLDTVTWQPRGGVRIATVVLPWAGGTVLAGRSLRRVEEMESAIEGLVVVGWVVLLVAVAGASFLSASLWPRVPIEAMHRPSPPSGR